MVKASVVVRTSNNERTIKKVLEGIRAQSFRDYEVVIVDSGSTDATLSIVKGYPHTFVDYSVEAFTYGGSLNAGCEAARGEYVISLSSHCIPLHGQWLGRLVEALDRHENLAGAYGQLVFDMMDYPVGDNEDIEVVTLDKFLERPNQGLRNPNSIIRRDLWSEYPFSEKVRTEDQEWAYHFLRQGYDTALVHGAQVLYAIPHSPYRYAQKTLRGHLVLHEMFGYRPKVSTAQLYRHSVRQFKAALLGKKAPRASSLSVSGLLGCWAMDKVLRYQELRDRLDKDGVLDFLPNGLGSAAPKHRKKEKK